MKVLTVIRNTLSVAVAVLALVEAVPPLLDRLEQARERRRVRQAAREVNRLIPTPGPETPF